MNIMWSCGGDGEVITEVIDLDIGIHHLDQLATILFVYKLHIRYVIEGWDTEGAF